jgi:hypothetical protein
LIIIFSNGTARKKFPFDFQACLKAVDSHLLFDNNTPKYLYFSTDAIDGKEAKSGKRAENCGVCKGKYCIRLPTPQKKQLPISHTGHWRSLWGRQECLRFLKFFNMGFNIPKYPVDEATVASSTLRV